MNELTKEKTMTIKEIAEILGVSRELITQKTRELFPEIIQNGKTTYLNEFQITFLKKNLVKKYEVETNLDIKLKIAEGYKLALEEIEKLQKENEMLKPKALFFDTVADSKTAIEIGTVAKTIDMGYGRNELFEILRDKKVLMSNNIPYQKYIDLEYFRVIEQKYSRPDGSICVNTKTLAYQKGIDFIIKLMKGII